MKINKKFKYIITVSLVVMIIIGYVGLLYWYSLGITKYSKNVFIKSDYELNEVKLMRVVSVIMPNIDEEPKYLYIEGIYLSKESSDKEEISRYLSKAIECIDEIDVNDACRLINYMLAKNGKDRIDMVLKFTNAAIGKYLSADKGTVSPTDMSELLDQRLMWTRGNWHNVDINQSDLTIRGYFKESIEYYNVYAHEKLSATYYEYSRYLAKGGNEKEAYEALSEGIRHLGKNRDRDASLCLEYGIKTFNKGDSTNDMEMMETGLSYISKAREARLKETNISVKLLTWKVFNEVRFRYYTKIKEVNELQYLMQDQRQLVIEWQKNEKAIGKQYHYLAELHMTLGLIRDVLGDKIAAINTYNIALNTSVHYRGKDAVETKQIEQFIKKRTEEP